MIKLENVGKIYNSNNNVAVGIRKVNLELSVNEFVAITGESGSGKTTLLNIISGIDTYEEGEMYVNGEETSYFQTEDLENYRNKYVGFIFQNYNIIDSYNVLQNVEAALLFDNTLSKKDRREKALRLIEKVGLIDKLKIKASKLSGGEKQRVVIARALAKDAPIIAADEPTGNLDSKSSEEVIKLLYEVSKDKLVLIVTHDFEEVKDYASRIIRVFDGEIKEDRILKETSKEVDFPDLPDHTSSAKKIDVLRLGLMDSFASPRKSIFHVVAFFLLAIFFLFVFAVYRGYNAEMIDLSFSAFTNTDNRRIAVNKKDGTPFTESELNAIEEISGVDYIVRNDLALDYVLYASFETGDYIHQFNNYYNSSANISIDDIDYGALPTNDSEIVITVEKGFLTPDLDSFNECLGKKVWIQNKEYTIKGIIDSSKESTSYVSYTYFLDSEYNLFSTGFKRTKVEFYFKDSDYNSGYEVALDRSLGDNQVYTAYYDNGIFDLVIKDRYQTYLDKRITNVYNGYDEIHMDYILYLSENLYNEYTAKENNVYQISIFSKNASRTSSIKNALDTSTYRRIATSETTSADTNIINTILSLVILVFLVSFMVAAFFITYATLSHSVKSKKDDIEILRTIGATKEDIRLMLLSEFVIETMIAFLTSAVIYVILLICLDNYALELIQYVTFWDFVILLVLMLLISLFLSLMYSKKMFKRSVKKSLEER